MPLMRFRLIWLAIFKEANIVEEMASEEFENWTAYLECEFKNEYNLTDVSVANAAKDAIKDAIKEMIVY